MNNHVCYRQTDIRWQHNIPHKRCDLRVGQLRQECRQTHDIQYLLLFRGNTGYANAPQSYFIRTLSVLLNFNPHLSDHYTDQYIQHMKLFK